MSDAPWEKGDHPDYAGFVIEVHVRKNKETGSVQSHRCLQDETDEKTTDILGPTGGMVEGASALLVEAARTEVMLQILYKTSNDAGFKQKLVSAAGAPNELLGELSQSTIELLVRALEKQIPDLVSEAMEMVRDGLRSQNG